MSHTKESWSIGDIDVFGAEIECSEGGLVAKAEIEEDARRIVACVNACAGIPTEQLESGEARSVRDELADIAMLEKQRDELLDALERMVRLLEIEDARLANFGEVEAARATIASVKGGAA